MSPSRNNKSTRKDLKQTETQMRLLHMINEISPSVGCNVPPPKKILLEHIQIFQTQWEDLQNRIFCPAKEMKQHNFS